MSQINRANKQKRPQWVYPERNSADTTDVSALEMLESIRNTLEQIRDLEHFVFAQISTDIRRLRACAERSERRYLRERGERRQEG